MEYLVKTNGLTKKYETQTVVKNVDKSEAKRS